MTDWRCAGVATPYYVHRGFPWSDFCREVVEPGANPNFPDGAVGVRVDDDFWVVAALPYDAYKDVGIEDIVAEFWPELAVTAEYGPDSGSPEREVK